MNITKYMTLYQTEECPHCQLVRKKLTLLNQPFLSMPLAPNGLDRKELIEISGQDEVPVLVNGEDIVVGSQTILKYLDENFSQGDEGPMPANKYGFSVTVIGTIERVKERVIEAIKKQGFGVLTEIDVKSTLKKKLDVDVPKQLILGACNPGFAHKAMTEEAAISLLLPCNVTIRETGPDEFEVSVINPLKLLSLIGREDFLPLANEVKTKLKAALAEVGN
jgi:uncharacterized protein (DUF302 family)/glutaredoxin